MDINVEIHKIYISQKEYEVKKYKSFTSKHSPVTALGVNKQYLSTKMLETTEL